MLNGDTVQMRVSQMCVSQMSSSPPFSPPLVLISCGDVGGLHQNEGPCVYIQVLYQDLRLLSKSDLDWDFSI